MAEVGSEVVRRAMGEAEAWFMCRVGYVETLRAVGLTAGNSAVRAFREEWPAFGVVAVDQELVESAASLALARDLRSLDALHLAAALLLGDEELVMASWDRRLHSAAQGEGLRVIPERLSLAPISCCPLAGVRSHTERERTLPLGGVDPVLADLERDPYSVGGSALPYAASTTSTVSSTSRGARVSPRTKFPSPTQG